MSIFEERVTKVTPLPPRGNRHFQDFVEGLVSIAKTKDRGWDVSYGKWKIEVECSMYLEPRDRKTLRSLGHELIGP